MRRSCLIVLAISLVVELAFAQDRELKPPGTLKLDGVPNIPASLGEVVERYQADSSDSLVGWNPKTRGTQSSLVSTTRLKFGSRLSGDFRSIENTAHAS